MIVFDIILDVVGYTTARLLLPTVTFGKVRVQSVSSTETGFNWLGFKREPDGTLICEAAIAGWIGLMPWALGVVLIVASA